MDIVHSHGHDPGVLDPRTDRLFVVALSQSPAKVMLRAADGAHLEIALPASGAPDRPAGTRCYMNLERTVVELRERLKPRDCGAAVIDRVNAISPPGCGAPLHFDIRTVWIVQLFGCKTWRLGDKPAVEQPSHNCVLPMASATSSTTGGSSRRRRGCEPITCFRATGFWCQRAYGTKRQRPQAPCRPPSRRRKAASRGLLGGCPHRVVIGRRVTPCSVVTGPLATKPNLW